MMLWGVGVRNIVNYNEFSSNAQFYCEIRFTGTIIKEELKEDQKRKLASQNSQKSASRSRLQSRLASQMGSK